MTPRNPVLKACRSGEAGVAPATPRAAASGLVLTQTSHTPDYELIQINQAQARVKGMQRAVLTSARLIHEGLQKGGFRYRPAMLTLTYKGLEDWRPKHISRLIGCIREYLRRKGYRLYGVWVAELQQRGAIHYHIVLWLPKGITLPKPDKQGWWSHGMTRVEWAKKAIGYIAKYASKADTKTKFPKGCRIHGALGMDKQQLMERRWWRFPSYVRQKFPEWSLDVVRAKGGGFLARATGEWVEGLYKLVGFNKDGPLLIMCMTPEWASVIMKKPLIQLADGTYAVDCR